MSLQDIAASLDDATATEEQQDTNTTRFADESAADDQHRRDMAGYDGGFTVDH